MKRLWHKLFGWVYGYNFYRNARLHQLKMEKLYNKRIILLEKLLKSERELNKIIKDKLLSP